MFVTKESTCDLESQYRQVFREAGLVNYLGVSGSQGEYNSIADLVGKFSLSVNEVQDRVLRRPEGCC